MTIVITIMVMLGLLLLKGFFSGSEIAMVSTDPVRLRHRASQGNRGAQLVLRLMQQPERLLSTTLIGTNVTTIALATMGAFLMVDLFGDRGELIAMLVYTPLFLIFGEIVPKSIYQQKAEILTPWIVYPLSWLQTVLTPLVYLFSTIARLVMRLLGADSTSDSGSRDQFLATVHMAEKSSEIAAFERGQVRRVLRFAHMTAADAMWQLRDMQSLSNLGTIQELVAVRQASGQRLIPLYDTSPTQITAVALLESWDLMDSELGQRQVADFHRPVCFVPLQQPISDIMDRLYAAPELTVIVVDDKGEGQGLITLSQLVRMPLGVDSTQDVSTRAT